MVHPTLQYPFPFPLEANETHAGKTNSFSRCESMRKYFSLYIYIYKTYAKINLNLLIFHISKYPRLFKICEKKKFKSANGKISWLAERMGQQTWATKSLDRDGRSFSVVGGECRSKLNREDQFGKLITRFVRTRRDHLPRVSIIRFRSASSAEPLDTCESRQTEWKSDYLARNHFPRVKVICEGATKHGGRIYFGRRDSRNRSLWTTTPAVNRRSSNSFRSINYGRQRVTTNTSSRPDVLLTVSRVLDRPPARPGNLFIRLRAPRKDGRMNHRDRFLLKL